MGLGRDVSWIQVRLVIHQGVSLMKLQVVMAILATSLHVAKVIMMMMIKDIYRAYP